MATKSKDGSTDEDVGESASDAAIEHLMDLSTCKPLGLGSWASLVSDEGSDTDEAGIDLQRLSSGWAEIALVGAERL